MKPIGTLVLDILACITETKLNFSLYLFTFEKDFPMRTQFVGTLYIDQTIPGFFLCVLLSSELQVSECSENLYFLKEIFGLLESGSKEGPHIEF